MIEDSPMQDPLHFLLKTQAKSAWCDHGYYNKGMPGSSSRAAYLRVKVPLIYGNKGLVTNYREGGLQNGRGGTWSFTPRKGGAEKVLAVLKGGGAQKVLG